MEYYEMSADELATFTEACAPMQDWFVNDSGISTITALSDVMATVESLK